MNVAAAIVYLLALREMSNEKGPVTIKMVGPFPDTSGISARSSIL